MLLRLEAENERELVHGGVLETKKRKYDGLKARQVGDIIVDLIVSNCSPIS
jgi:hypothetical protein